MGVGWLKVYFLISVTGGFTFWLEWSEGLTWKSALGLLSLGVAGVLLAEIEERTYQKGYKEGRRAR